jgi:hypothetical protein
MLISSCCLLGQKLAPGEVVILYCTFLVLFHFILARFHTHHRIEVDRCLIRLSPITPRTRKKGSFQQLPHLRMQPSHSLLLHSTSCANPTAGPWSSPSSSPPPHSLLKPMPWCCEGWRRGRPPARGGAELPTVWRLPSRAHGASSCGSFGSGGLAPNKTMNEQLMRPSPRHTCRQLGLRRERPGGARRGGAPPGPRPQPLRDGPAPRRGLLRRGGRGARGQAGGGEPDPTRPPLLDGA